jgi:hypothetical protein
VYTEAKATEYVFAEKAFYPIPMPDTKGTPRSTMIEAAHEKAVRRMRQPRDDGKTLIGIIPRVHAHKTKPQDRAASGEGLWQLHLASIDQTSFTLLPDNKGMASMLRIEDRRTAVIYRKPS